MKRRQGRRVDSRGSSDFTNEKAFGERPVSEMLMAEEAVILVHDHTHFKVTACYLFPVAKPVSRKHTETTILLLYASSPFASPHFTMCVGRLVRGRHGICRGFFLTLRPRPSKGLRPSFFLSPPTRTIQTVSQNFHRSSALVGVRMQKTR